MSAPPIPSAPADLELIARLKSQLQYAELRIRVLQERLRLMRIEKYGAGGEKLFQAQMQLFEHEPVVSEKIEQLESEHAPVHRSTKKSSKHPGRQELPANLPPVERILPCTTDQRLCKLCGKETVVIGYEESSQLDVEPAKYFVLVTKRDRTHVLSLSQVYELPFGPGKKIFNRGGALMKNLLGGWSFSGHYSYASGTPVKITVNGLPLGIHAFNRANIMPGSFDVNWDNYYKGLPVFNIKKFQFPGAWRVGNAAPFYSGFRNPFESNETVGLSKRFFLGERVKAELRVEFDNVLNRMRVCGGDKMDNNPYDVAGLDPNNTNFNFGIVSPGAVCQGNTPRRGQAFFKITF